MSLFPQKKRPGEDDEDEDDVGIPEELTSLMMFAGGGRQKSISANLGMNRATGSMRRVSVIFDKDLYAYGSIEPQDRQIQLGKPTMVASRVERQLSEVIWALFMEEHHHSHAHPRTNPQLPPERRFKRHRNYYIWSLNQFRHWWKTSRLLVRVSGGYVYCQDPLNWTTMAIWKVSKDKQAKHALKQMKDIGKGGPIRIFLQKVHPFTRSIRIILAVARAWEARADNRLYEVGLAEGLYVHTNALNAA